GQFGNEDYFNALLAACSILMALRHRQPSGEGQYLESPQVNSALFVTSEVIVGQDGRTLSAFQLDSEQTGLGPLYRLYRAADDWICIACAGDGEFRSLCRALGQDDLAADPRFATARARAENAEILTARLAEAFRRRTAAEWFAILDRA